MAHAQLAYALLGDFACEYCEDDLEHCHGVALISDAGVVCSDDPDCDVAVEFHQFAAQNE